MNQGTTHLVVTLPAPEAADLAVMAARSGISTPDFLGYHVLRSAYGAMHPQVQAFETAAQVGTSRER